jgi:hypothetical protein
LSSQNRDSEDRIFPYQIEKLRVEISKEKNKKKINEGKLAYELPWVVTPLIMAFADTFIYIYIYLEFSMI